MKNSRNPLIATGFGSFLCVVSEAESGGDYRTQICDLLRVNVGGKLFSIVYNAFQLFLLFLFAL